MILWLPNAEGHWAIGREIVIDASRARNCMALINDPRGFPGGKTANVMSVQVLDCATGQLHLFIITRRPVKAGEELLLDYGKVRMHACMLAEAMIKVHT